MGEHHEWNCDHSSLWSVKMIANLEPNSSKEVNTTNHGSSDWILKATSDHHGNDLRDALKIVVVDSLSLVKFHPALISKLHGVSATSVVWVPSFHDLSIQGLFVLLAEFLLHPLLGEEILSWCTTLEDASEIVEDHDHCDKQSPSIIV